VDRDHLSSRLLDQAIIVIERLIDGPLQDFVAKNYKQLRLSKPLVKEIAARLTEIALSGDTALPLTAQEISLLKHFQALEISKWPRPLMTDFINGISKSNLSRDKSREGIDSEAPVLTASQGDSSSIFWALAESSINEDVESDPELPEFSAARIKQLHEEIRQGFMAYATKYRDLMFVRSEEQLVTIQFVKNWALETLGQSNLDDEQALAVAAVTGNNQVLARAGSGKTAVLTIRLCFLMLECNLKPETLLALTFNREAKEEMISRVRGYLIFHHELKRSDFASAQNLRAALENNPREAEKQARERGIALPLIMTFHGLAFQILLANLGKGAPKQIEGEDNAKNIRLEKIIRGRLTQEVGDNRLKLILRQYFQDDWEWLTDLAGSPKDLLEIRKHLTYETLRGEKVKSHGERKIANWLFKSRIHYAYENALWTKERYLFPDFSILQNGTRVGVIEYVGLIGEPGYDTDLKKKLSAYSSLSLPHLLIRPEDIRGDSTNYVRKIVEFFRQINLEEPAKLSEEEVWSSVKVRFIDGGYKSRFVSNMTQFIGKAMRDAVTPDSIRENAPKLLANDSVGREFALVAADIYESYLSNLQKNNEIDQTGSLVEAVALLKRSKPFVRLDGVEVSLSELRSISVDEHQDFTNLFGAMLTSLAKISGANVFTVGDDWQCINRFMGADPKLFDSFVSDWPNAVRLEMPTNYRSTASIVSLSNSLMGSSHATPAKASTTFEGSAAIYFCDDLEQRSVETGAVRDIRGRALRRLLIRELSMSDTGNIAILTRTNHLPWIAMPNEETPNSEPLMKYIATILPGLNPSLSSRIKVSTVHSYKGLESDTVIVLDVQHRSFPLIHSDIRFQSYFQTDPMELIEDERKLLYVAMTRPRNRLHLLSRSDVPGPFLTGRVMRAVRGLNTMTSAFAVCVTSSIPHFTPSALNFLKREGFTISTLRRNKESKALLDVTAYVLNSGGLPEAKLSWESDNQMLVQGFLRHDLSFELIAENRSHLS
jgi:DNA helicase-4